MRSYKIWRRGFFLLWGLIIAGSVPPAVSQQQIRETTDRAATQGRQQREKAEKAIVEYMANPGETTKRSPKDSTIYLTGNVGFHHNGTFIQCDSAHRYDDYRMQGFGNVIIHKDSTFIYGDRVSYDGHTDMATVYSPIVKLVNTDLTMWVNDIIEFNTRTSVGSYGKGGVISQRDNLMESDRGLYFGDSSVIVFAGNVALKNDNYLIRTDSVGYNLDEEKVTFLTWTYIWDKERDFLLAEEGDYVRATETYHFTRNAYVMTEDQEFWADTMNYRTVERLVTMSGNIQILDTTQQTIALGDEGYYSDSLNKGMLTRLPAVIGYEQRQELRPDSVPVADTAGDTIREQPVTHRQTVSDSAYMRADTLFFDTYPLGTMKPLSTAAVAAIAAIAAITDTAIAITDTAIAITITDTAIAAIAITDTTITDTIAAITDTTAIVDTDTLERVIRAYYNVRLFRSDVQAIADSMISYSVDSSASLFGGPIIWHGDNQLTADQINLYSGNEQLEYAEYIGTPFLTQKVEHADSLFNQAQGRYLETWFRNNEIVRALMSGNVENYYYTGEDSLPPDKFATIMAATLTVDFEDREPVRMHWGGSANWTVYPIDSIPASQMQRLSGFSWEPALKPKDRYEITTRRVRLSARREANGYVRPEFVIDRDLIRRKEELIKRGIWRDRNDVLRISISDFQNNMFLF